jgi:nucleoside-diphosphate-sugar epimerase
VSRRAPDFSSRARFLQLDLTDREACQRVFAASELNDVSHVVYAALFEKPDLIAGWQDAEQIETNLLMLRNVLDFLGSSLRHVTLLQGTKAYGAHIKPMTNPGRESDPRHEGPNFYWAQEDYVRDLAASKDWVFSIMRPQIVCGTALGSPMNMIAALGVLAAVQRERGEPLCFPGGAPYVTQATDADLLARAILWAAEEPRCANQTFNIANGDVLIWQTSWPTIAQVFGMEVGAPVPMRLAEVMPGCEDVWSTLVARYDLRPTSLEQLVGSSWQFADAVFGYGGAPPDTIVSTVKARRYGFHDCCDTNEMFERQLQHMQAQRLLPPLSRGVGW